MQTTSDLVAASLPFWGPPSATIDWCEDNYKLTRFVAEPLNTVSNLSFVVLGILGALHEIREGSKRSYIVLYSTVAAIGVGSMLFHGTLTGKVPAR
jgi:dihydroceramidase